MKIKKIQIENTSSLTISECVKYISDLLDTESTFIDESRDKGCTFTYTDNVIVIFPISPIFPEDTLSFYIFDKKDIGK